LTYIGEAEYRRHYILAGLGNQSLLWLIPL
jgi:hypothetical protein